MTTSTAVCPFHQSCHFYNIQKPTPNTEVLKERYCQGEPRMCLIYRLKAEHRPVPITQWPNGSLL